MIVGLFSALSGLLRPDAATAEMLLAVGLLAAVLAASVLRRDVPATVRTAGAAADRFTEVRVLLGASRPDAAGHRRARAPGATR